MFKNSLFYTLIIFLVASIFSGCRNNATVSEQQEMRIQHYLEEHRSTFMGSSMDSIDFSSIADHFQGSRLILLGETHGSSLNEELDIQLFKYLYNNHGVRFYLAENGYGAGILINEYIQTGDIHLLSSVFQVLKGTFSHTEENYQRIINLREFNASLPSYAKITYLGIDIEQQAGLGIQAISSFTRDNYQHYPIQIRQVLAAIKQHRAGNHLSAFSFASFLIKQLQDPSSQSDYERAFTGHYNEVILILENILLRSELYQDDSAYLSRREDRIAKNFQFVYQKHTIGNFYGKWGAFHIWKHNVHNQESSFLKKVISAGYLKSNEAVSIPIFYEDSFYADRNNKYMSTPITSMLAPDLIQANDNNPFTIFDLNETGSPFGEKLLLIDGAKGVTTDYFDIMIKISGSKASKRKD